MSAQDDMIERMVEAAAARLAEHCDSVVVIVTYARPAESAEGPRTGIYKAGRGNYYAQRGSIKTVYDYEDQTETRDDEQA